MKELFEIPQQDSPRLAWLKKHRVMTNHNKGVSAGDECPETGLTMYPWGAFVGPSFGEHWAEVGWGDTEHEAIVDLALKQGWKLWNEE